MVEAMLQDCSQGEESWSAGDGFGQSGNSQSSNGWFSGHTLGLKAVYEQDFSSQHIFMIPKPNWKADRDLVIEPLALAHIRLANETA